MLLGSKPGDSTSAAWARAAARRLPASGPVCLAAVAIACTALACAFVAPTHLETVIRRALSPRGLAFATGQTSSMASAKADLDAVLSGGWADVDLTPLDALATALSRHLNVSGLEGHSAQLVVERKVYYALASMPAIRTICEIGFNGGHSASIWLHGKMFLPTLRSLQKILSELHSERAERDVIRFVLMVPQSLRKSHFFTLTFSLRHFHVDNHVPRLANPTAQVYMFDLWTHKYSPAGEAFLRGPKAAAMGIVNADSRLHITKGPSQVTVPTFATEHPGLRCDLLSVDGGHTYDMAVADITNMAQLANPNFNVLLVDDTNCASSWCVDAAVQEQQRRGLVHRLAGFSEGRAGGNNFSRGVTVGRYMISAN